MIEVGVDSSRDGVCDGGFLVEIELILEVGLAL